MNKPTIAGFALHIRGSLAMPLFEAERGRHEWQRTNSKLQCLIETFSEEPKDLKPDPKTDSRELALINRVRVLNERTKRIESARLRGEGIPWSRSKTVDCLHALFRDRLLEQAESLIE